jgi:NF-kappa-B-activating protein C-terminal domain
MPAPESEYYYR